MWIGHVIHRRIRRARDDVGIMVGDSSLSPDGQRIYLPTCVKDEGSLQRRA